MVTSGLQIDMHRQIWFLEKIFPVLLLVFVCFKRLYAYGNIIKISEKPCSLYMASGSELSPH